MSSPIESPVVGTVWKIETEVGNAVSVPVATWVANSLRKPGAYNGDDDPIYSGKKGWPDAAWWDADAGQMRVAAVSDWPRHAPAVQLDTFLQQDLKPLSAKATRGFVLRARKGSLWYPEGFLERLERHADGVDAAQASRAANSYRLGRGATCR